MEALREKKICRGINVPQQTSASQLQPKPSGKRLFDFNECLFFSMTKLLIFLLLLFIPYKSPTFFHAMSLQRHLTNRNCAAAL